MARTTSYALMPAFWIICSVLLVLGWLFRGIFV